MPAETDQLSADPNDHLVQFYPDDDQLTACAGAYLAEGLAAGAAVLVLATQARRRAFERQLAVRGADVAASRDRGVFLDLDAAGILNRFLIGGRVDPADFEQVVGGLIRRAAADGRPVRVYGEMAALLWDAGRVSAAVELEALWNELGRLVPFSLLCGYPAAMVSGDQHADAQDEVCALHSAVIGRPAAASGAGRQTG